MLQHPFTDLVSTPYPTGTGGPTRDRMFQGCRKIVAGYAGVPDDRNLEERTNVLMLPVSEGEWADGNRGVRCYLGLDGKVTRSLKGAGPGGLPIRGAGPAR